MNTFIEVLRWVVVSISMLYILAGSEDIGRKRENKSLGEYITKSVVAAVTIYLLVRGL